MDDVLFRFCSENVVFQEVPGEISLAYTMTGCPVGCKGCHSVDSWPVGSGIVLTRDHLRKQLSRYQGLVTCLLFMGGEWRPEALIKSLQLAQSMNLKTCLYTGQETISLTIRQYLSYLKTGPWIAAKGGLDSPDTNQRFYDLTQEKLLNIKFQ